MRKSHEELAQVMTAGLAGLTELVAAALDRSDQLSRENAHLREEILETRRRLDWLVEVVQGGEASAEARWVRLFSELELDRDLAEATWEQARLAREDVHEARVRLSEVRRTPAYAAAFEDTSPLVTVRIATYRRTKELLSVALPSVLRQTHQNLEVVIVNDGPYGPTREAVAELHDPRVRFEETPVRALYPRHPHLRWMVAGSPGMNRGVELARGSWIAPLDDDDEFEPDHIERLLALARERGAEVAYGAVRRVDLATGAEHLVFSDPPQAGGFSFQGALYLKALDFLPYDTESWRSREPGDWNLARRMLETGVLFAATEAVVATMYSAPYDDPARS